MAPLRPSAAAMSTILGPSSKRISSHPYLFTPQSSCSTSLPCTHQQVRHATFLRRPKRPYTFTQLVTLSDGSSYLHRTSSPAPIHKSIKDQRNAPLWNPSSAHLQTIEADAAGRLRAFRARFGRGWDMEDGTAPAVTQEAVEAEEDGARELRGENAVMGDMDAVEGQSGRPEGRPATGDSLLDLISGFKMNEDIERGLKSKKERPTPSGGGGKKKK